MNSLDFSHDEVERSRRYHRPRYLALAVGTLLVVVALIGLRFASDDLARLGWAGAAVVWAAIVVCAQNVVTLPLHLWTGHVRERRWGFSTQSVGGWLADRGKALTLVNVSASTHRLLEITGLQNAFDIRPAQG